MVISPLHMPPPIDSLPPIPAEPTDAQPVSPPRWALRMATDTLLRRRWAYYTWKTKLLLVMSAAAMALGSLSTIYAAIQGRELKTFRSVGISLFGLGLGLYSIKRVIQEQNRLISTPQFQRDVQLLAEDLDSP